MQYRKHFFNERYFEEIDSPEKAYWLGFTHADGSLVYSATRGRIVCLDLRIKVQDSALIDEFVKDIGGNVAFIEQDRERRGIRLRSTVLYDSLLALGVTPRKSYSDDPAIIGSGPLFAHYVRGYFDGNGSVSKVRKHLVAQVVGPRQLCEDIYSGIRRDTGIRGGNVYPCPYADRHVVMFQTLNQCRMLGEWMYRDASRYLGRKRAVFAA